MSLRYIGVKFVKFHFFTTFRTFVFLCHNNKYNKYVIDKYIKQILNSYNNKKIMVLTAFDKGILEQLFDESVLGIKRDVDVARDEMFENILNDKDGTDLALGFAIGTIHTSFITGFRRRNGRSLNHDELMELMHITKNHLDKLKEAIFQCD